MSEHDDKPDMEVMPGHNAWDAFVAVVYAIRDILNDWRAMTALLIVILLLAGKMAGGELGAIVESWIRAWRCQP